MYVIYMYAYYAYSMCVTVNMRIYNIPILPSSCTVSNGDIYGLIGNQTHMWYAWTYILVDY